MPGLSASPPPWTFQPGSRPDPRSWIQGGERGPRPGTLRAWPPAGPPASERSGTSGPTTSHPQVLTSEGLVPAPLSL